MRIHWHGEEFCLRYISIVSSLTVILSRFKTSAGLCSAQFCLPPWFSSDWVGINLQSFWPTVNSLSNGLSDTWSLSISAITSSDKCIFFGVYSRNLPSTVQLRKPSASWVRSTFNSPGVPPLTGSITNCSMRTSRPSSRQEGCLCGEQTFEQLRWTGPGSHVRPLKSPPSHANHKLIRSFYLFSVWLSKHSKHFSLITQDWAGMLRPAVQIRLHWWEQVHPSAD